MTSHNVVVVYPTMLHCLGAAAGTEAAQLAGCEEDRKYLDGLSIHPAASALLWLQDQRRNKDRRRLVWCWREAFFSFLSAWHLAEPSALHLLSARVHVWCIEGREMQPCQFAWIRHCSILQCVRDCVAPQPLQLHPTLLSHHLHAHTYATRAHPAYWSVTMETECLLPKSGGEVMEAAEEEVNLYSSTSSWISHINNWRDTFKETNITFGKPNECTRRSFYFLFIEKKNSVHNVFVSQFVCSRTCTWVQTCCAFGIFSNTFIAFCFPTYLMPKIVFSMAPHFIYYCFLQDKAVHIYIFICNNNIAAHFDFDFFIF